MTGRDIIWRQVKLKFEKLGEFETKIVTFLGGGSVTHTGLTDEKT
jgi:hypothetical protein